MLVISNCNRFVTTYFLCQKFNSILILKGFYLLNKYFTKAKQTNGVGVGERKKAVWFPKQINLTADILIASHGQQNILYSFKVNKGQFPKQGKCIFIAISNEPRLTAFHFVCWLTKYTLLQSVAWLIPFFIVLGWRKISNSFTTKNYNRLQLTELVKV